MKATNIEDGELLTTFDVDYPDHLGEPFIVDASCKKNKKFDLLCRVVLTTENAAVVQVQSGKSFTWLDGQDGSRVKVRLKLYTAYLQNNIGPKTWIREESLANIAAIEMLDLPLLDNEGAIEKQLKSRNGKQHMNTF